MEDLKITNAIYNEDDNTVYVNAIKTSTLSSVTFTTILKNESMDTVEYKTPEKGYVEHKELDPDTEIKFIPDYEVLDEEETEELEDYFAKLNSFPESYMECYGKMSVGYDMFYDKYCDKCKDIKGEGVYDEVCREGCEFYKNEFKKHI